MLPQGINPRQMQQMMKRMGIKTEEIDAESVVIHGTEKDIVIENPQVVKTIMQGQESFQISGTVKEQEKNASGDESEISISEEDIKVVMEQAKVSEEEAIAALEKSAAVRPELMTLKKAEEQFSQRRASVVLIVAGLLFITTWELAKSAVQRLRDPSLIQARVSAWSFAWRPPSALPGGRGPGQR